MPDSNFTNEDSFKNNILYSPLALANRVDISNGNDPYYPLEYCVTSNNVVTTNSDTNTEIINLKLQIDELRDIINCVFPESI